MEIRIEESADKKRIKLTLDNQFVIELDFVSATRLGWDLVRRAEAAVNAETEKVDARRAAREVDVGGIWAFQDHPTLEEKDAAETATLDVPGYRG